MASEKLKQRLPLYAFGVVCGGLLVLASSPLGYRLGWISLSTALIYVPFAGVVIASVGAVLSLLAMLIGARDAPRVAWSLGGLVLGVLAVAYPVNGAVKARSVPSIHDITTDTEDPPQFVALAGARRAAPNGLAYGGAPVAAQQRSAYPDIAPLDFSVAPGELFAHAERVARAAGWEVAAAAPEAGRIEATATTRLYGFKDDVVIRIKPAAAGSRLDMRSTSRLGQGDIGANAARIRAYRAELQRRLADTAQSK